MPLLALRLKGSTMLAFWIPAFARMTQQQCGNL